VCKIALQYRAAIRFEEFSNRQKSALKQEISLQPPVILNTQTKSSESSQQPSVNNLGFTIQTKCDLHQYQDVWTARKKDDYTIEKSTMEPVKRLWSPFHLKCTHLD
jgi:hypothetical protein